MTGFTPKQPAHYEFPYKHMLHDFTIEIEAYIKKRGISPGYIIIHPDDMESLLAEMISFKLLQAGKPTGKLQFSGIRIIESPGLIKSFFEVVGN